MALRDENYLFTRRIADRGSDKTVFDSQDRTIQETDPKDVIWDEIVGKEEHPEEGDGCKFQETDSEAFIRDENYGKEEYPGSCSTLYSSHPCFDCYGDKEVSNEEDGPDSRARGEDQFIVCRTADRGNNKADPDPWDLKIKRLQQRIHDLEASSMWEETELEETVGNDLSGDEEHPTNIDTIFDSSPVYDEYEDEEWYYWMTGVGVTYDSTEYVTDSLSSLKGRLILAVDSSLPCSDCYEDYWWVTRALNVVVVQEGGTVQEEITGGSLECVKVSAGILNDFAMGDKTEIGGVNGLVPLVANGDRKAIIGLIAGSCMDVKVACGCGMHGFFQLTCGGSIEKHREPVELNKEVCMKTELDDATTKFDGQIRGIDYVFDPGGWFLKLSKLEDEFFSKRRRMMRIDMDQFELEPC